MREWAALESRSGMSREAVGIMIGGLVVRLKVRLCGNSDCMELSFDPSASAFERALLNKDMGGREGPEMRREGLEVRHGYVAGESITGWSFLASWRQVEQ